MLKITIPSREMYNENTQEFFTTKEYVLQLEHSLVSISKWEAKWNIPFLTKEEKSIEQILDYIKCMNITQNIGDDVFKYLTNDNIKDIKAYIEAPMTATTFGKSNDRRNNEIITSELIYYWMIALNIPMECQKWHINRLLTLVRICNIKNAPAKKMSPREVMSRNAALNAARRQKFHTSG